MSYYYRNRERANFSSKKPSLTDQSQAAMTDINVIIRDFLKTGTTRGPATPPTYADMTRLPQDLRGLIEQSRSIGKLRKQLPKELKDMPMEELLSLTPEKLKEILTPPATPPANEEEKK